MGTQIIKYIKAIIKRYTNRYKFKRRQSLGKIAKAVKRQSLITEREHLIHELVKSYEVLADKYNDGELAIRELERKVRGLTSEQRKIIQNFDSRIQALENPNE